MPITGPKQQDETEDSFFAEVNITPLTDVILVLLIIFMVSSSAMVDAVRDGQLDVDLPRAGAKSASLSAKDALVVSILEDGRVGIEGKIVGEQEILQALKDQYKKNPSISLVIDADGDLAHRKVVHVIDLAREAGFNDVGIGVRPNFE